jgi:hypothetical protein
MLAVNGKGPGESLGREQRYEVVIRVFSLTPLVGVSLVADGEKIREWRASGSHFEVTDVLEASQLS